MEDRPHKYLWNMSYSYGTYMRSGCAAEELKSLHEVKITATLHGIEVKGST